MYISSFTEVQLKHELGNSNSFFNQCSQGICCWMINGWGVGGDMKGSKVTGNAVQMIRWMKGTGADQSGKQATTLEKEKRGGGKIGKKTSLKNVAKHRLCHSLYWLLKRCEIGALFIYFFNYCFNTHWSKCRLGIKCKI